MSMSGGWFFVVASEAISVGNTTVALPGIGSYIALAIEQRDLAAIGWAIATMLVVILLYDQLLFRPLVAWADRFRFEQEPGVVPPRSWVLDVLRRSRLVDRADAQPFASCCGAGPIAAARRQPPAKRAAGAAASAAGVDAVVDARHCSRSVALALWQIVRFVIAGRRASRRAGRRSCSASLTHAARRRADRARQPDLGADRRLGRHCGRARRESCSRWRSSSPPSRRICCSRSRSRRSSPGKLNPEHLAEPADDPRHAVVHPVQCHRRRRGHAGGAARRRRQSQRAAAGCGGARSRCRRLPVLRDRRDHRLGRLVERQHRRRGRELGRQQLEAHGLGAYIAERPRPAISIASCSASR